jgi:hypothetical protein
MGLSPAQLAALKADIAANTTVISSSGQQTPINELPQTDDAAFDIAQWYNQFPGTDFFGNYRTVPYEKVANAINWKNYTPADAIPTDTALNVAIWQARSLACQGYMFNLQTLLTGRATIDATNANLVQGIKDATLTVIPSGANGTLQSGGWGVIQAVLCRRGTKAEKLLATAGAPGSATDGSATNKAATFTFEGSLDVADVRTARAS